VPEEEPIFVAGEERSEEGLPVIPEPPITPLVSGSGYATVLAFGFSTSPFLEQTLQGTAIFDADGRMTSVDSLDFFGEYNIGTGTHADFGTDGILAWGRWTGDVFVGVDGSLSQTYGPDQGLHYVIGKPTTTMPTGGTASYQLAGATRPTYLDGGTAPGTLSGSLSVNFGTGTVGTNLNIAMPDNRTYVVGGSSTISGSQFFGFAQQGSLTVSGTGGACSSGCDAAVSGFFAGSSAERAGLGFHVNDFLANKDVVGAAAFQKQ
jgi:hypothetical protein